MNPFSKKERLQAEDSESPNEVEEENIPDEEFSEKLESYRKEAQELLDSYRKFFTTFAKDVSLDFKMSNAFYINFETGEVNLDAGWFAEQGYSKEQILWAVMHELSHFRDFAQDPEGMMEHFVELREKARKTGEFMMGKWEEKYGETDPEFIEAIKKRRPAGEDPEDTLNPVEGVAYKMHHTFDNILMDIYANNLLSRRASNYERGEKGGEEVERLYTEKLFRESDYSDRPRHLQFAYHLIRKEMAPESDMEVGEDVQEALDRKIRVGGEEYTPREIVNNFIKPKYGRDTTPATRNLVIDEALAPIFEELLLKDLEEWDPQKPEKRDNSQGDGDGDGEQQGGESSQEIDQSEGDQQQEEEQQEDTGEDKESSGSSGSVDPNDLNPYSQEYKEYEERSPDQINHDEFEEWAEEYEEQWRERREQKEKEEEEEQKTPEEKARESQEKMDREFSEKHGIDPKTMRAYRKVERDIEPYLKDLAQLWQRIIYGASREMERDMEGHYKEGSELDIQKTVEEWPKIQSGDFEEVRIMKKMTSKETEVKKPERIRVRLLGDVSGSMDERKFRVLERCLVLLLASLREFNTYLERTRRQTKSKLEADTEAWAFGEREVKLKNFREETGNEEEQAEIIRVFEKLRKVPGLGTNDAAALEAVLGSITPEEKEKIEAEKIMEIVFEVTDGGSSSRNAAREAVDALLESGVIVRAFQIGEVSEYEKEAFDHVWNNWREEGMGEAIGENIEDLLPAMTELLKKYLEGVRV